MSWWKADLTICHNFAQIKISGEIKSTTELARFIDTLSELAKYLPESEPSTPPVGEQL